MIDGINGQIALLVWVGGSYQVKIENFIEKVLTAYRYFED